MNTSWLSLSLASLAVPGVAGRMAAPNITGPTEIGSRRSKRRGKEDLTLDGVDRVTRCNIIVTPCCRTFL
jgi:hypothetical protein